MSHGAPSPSPAFAVARGTDRGRVGRAAPGTRLGAEPVFPTFLMPVMTTSG
ncbi:hypothetical protein [Streptomyces sp. NPDC004266]|uniref:hypothetical protein n=1 Tax=Streptomyces sp. NPDC004266 TaxID=3364693 RepID=UPI0036B19758